MADKIIPQEFFVYGDFKATTGELFYVGKGLAKRLKFKTRANRRWANIVRKHGYIRKLYDPCTGAWVPLTSAGVGMLEDFSFEVERNLISLYGRKDDGTGPLVNGTNGGDGSGGHKKSKQSIAASLAGIRAKKERFARFLCVDFGYSFATLKDAANWMTACGISTNSSALLACIRAGVRHKGLLFTMGKIGEGDQMTPAELMLDAKAIFDYATAHKTDHGALISATKKKNAHITRAQTLERMNKNPDHFEKFLRGGAKHREDSKRDMLCKENGRVFKGLPEIADWLFNTTGRTTDAKGVWNACNGNSRSAYGYTWAYA